MSEPHLTEDDHILPFQAEGLDVRGRVVRLGPAIDTILRRHDYPAPVSRAVGEATALALLLGTTLKFDGRFILQTRTDGPVRMLVVDFQAPDRVRACATFDKDAVAAAIEAGKTSTIELLGSGHLAMTIDQGPDMARYQGIVALEGESLEAAADQYFRQSEQIPTRVRLAVAENYVAGEGASWRAGGMMIQFLPSSPERMRMADLPPGDAPEGAEVMQHREDDAWVEAKLLMGTVEDHELTDPNVSAEELLYRLFHERGARVFESSAIIEKCRCSREAVTTMLRNFSQQDRRDMVADDGSITVTCEFCNARYDFDKAETEELVNA
ncbi:Hsp33 family molecular chaperone [Labrys sp. LIt4]|uniref:Hsp33 family molecular chaperone n=1 Tax=Labrys okinawensis TaxID=346911 RepID=A0A2S9QEC7_9HYPH|nr:MULTISPECIES: Hsp33 family molecular chaperone [Labrys]MBP0577907.1 Hsp33 family molecular chaperone [Labrys sp. LIt4]PRH87699.1 Hsp33 family molecular chaperone [Labrys okinawensis]